MFVVFFLLKMHNGASLVPSLLMPKRQLTEDVLNKAEESRSTTVSSHQWLFGWIDDRTRQSRAQRQQTLVTLSKVDGLEELAKDA